MARIYPYDDSADALFSPAKGLGPKDYFQEWDGDDMPNRMYSARKCRAWPTRKKKS